MSKEEILEEIKSIFLRLTEQEPTPDDEIEAKELLIESFKILKALRENKISCDKDHVGKSVKAQFKYSDKIDAKYTIVLGDDEIEKDLATLRICKHQNKQR